MPARDYRSTTKLPDATAAAVLNSVVCRGRSTVDGLVAATGLSRATVDQQIAVLSAAGHVQHAAHTVIPGPLGATVARAYNQQLWAHPEDAVAVGQLPDRFEHADELMRQGLEDFLTAQASPAGAAEVKSDQALSRIDAIASKAERLLGQLATKIPRFSRYTERLEEALEIAQADPRYVTDPHVESVEVIWSEMIADVRLLLGDP